MLKRSVDSSVMPLSAYSDSSLLAELVSPDARGDASGWHVPFL